ncbi:hypothetical protein CMI37_36485 [Candidatus Pacearchaeota archaeon]|nr:hypothetical protein [Candidatus Pacearchaeota archaeon]
MFWDGCRYEGDDFFEDYEDEELEQEAGTTPGSVFYFLDKFFDRFGDELKVKEERIAEIKVMVEAGDLESAEIALKEYIKLANELEHEIDPERREDAKRSAAAIRAVMKGIRDQLPPEERGKFVREIMSKEHSIAAAAEIAGKIKELCQALSEIDPVEYSRICVAGDDAPKWQKELDKRWTGEQREEAKKFGKIMAQCFKTSGQDCKCDEIPFSDFADACSVAAPLATACDIEGDESACVKLDSLQMPELPEHLQEVFDDLESGMMESKFEMHMPRECVEAGVTKPKECGKIMIKTHSPQECKQALLDSGCEREMDCRKICDKIMMKKHAPKCAEKRITDPDECARFMDNFRGGDRMGGPMIDFNCKEISDPAERLDCYDKASSQAKGFGGMDDDYKGNCMTESDWKAKKTECKAKFGDHAGDEPIMGDSGQGYKCPIDAKCIDFSQGKIGFGEIKQKEKECASKCESQQKAWDFSYGVCKCYGSDWEDGGEGPSDGWDEGPGCHDCAAGCPGASRTDCVNDRCECYYDGDEYTDTSPVDGGDDTDSGTDGGGDTDSGAGGGGGTDSGDGGGVGGGGSGGSDSGGSSGGGDSGGSDSGGSSGGGGSGGSNDGGSDSGGGGDSGGGSDGGGSGGGGGGVTGDVVGGGFLDYYYG